MPNAEYNHYLPSTILLMTCLLLFLWQINILTKLIIRIHKRKNMVRLGEFWDLIKIQNIHDERKNMVVFAAYGGDGAGVCAGGV